MRGEGKERGGGGEGDGEDKRPGEGWKEEASGRIRPSSPQACCPHRLAVADPLPIFQATVNAWTCPSLFLALCSDTRTQKQTDNTLLPQKAQKLKKERMTGTSNPNQSCDPGWVSTPLPHPSLPGAA